MSQVVIHRGSGGGGAGTSLSWNETTGTSQSLIIRNGYVANNAALVTFTLPTNGAIGDTIKVVGKGAGGWRIAQNASQFIQFGNKVTTTGTGGRLDSTNRYDCVEFICTTTNTGWLVINSVGNISLT